jgi:nitroreductase
MKNKLITAFFLISIFLFIGLAAIYAQDIKPIKLPVPQMEGGKPLMQALRERKSLREFSSQELPLQAISDLLWAAFGINRPDSGGRTAPSPMNTQEIDIYVVKKEGVYLYQAQDNMLIPVVSGDLRAIVGIQPFVKEAPINLIFVADLSKMQRIPSEEIDFYAGCDTGFISQNVYLYCASVGLSTVARAWIDKPMTAKAMKLLDNQKIILAQTVGYPK